MKTNINQLRHIPGCTLVLLFLAGCAWEQKHAATQPPTTVAAQPAPVPAAEGFGPTHVMVEENGIKYFKSIMAFPTGQPASSGLLVEKLVPVEVLVGQSFEYRYKVSNVTDHPVHMVMVTDKMTGSFVPADADPKPAETHEGVAVWQLGTLGAKETTVIKVKGAGKDEGALNTCGWASYSPLICEDIRVVRPDLQLSATAPAEILVCDPVPVKLVVKNSGSSALSDVKIAGALPEGMLSDGQNNVSFDAGTLAPGESRDFDFKAIASSPGTFATSAKATAAQGVHAEASTSTTVREPRLKVTCEAPERQYLGRSFDVKCVVTNQGDGAAGAVVLEAPVPEGLTFKSASGNGHISDNKVVWDLGTLEATAQQTATATFVGAAPGNFEFNGKARGTCAKEAIAMDTIRLTGLAAILLEKADDPDPVQVGDTTTYTVKVTNQGTAPDSNIRIVVTLPEEIAPVSAAGCESINAQVVTFPIVGTLAPKDAVTYKIVAKGVKPGDAHTKFLLTSDVLVSPISAEESTHIY